MQASSWLPLLLRSGRAGYALRTPGSRGQDLRRAGTVSLSRRLLQLEARKEHTVKRERPTHRDEHAGAERSRGDNETSHGQPTTELPLSQPALNDFEVKVS